MIKELVGKVVELVYPSNIYCIFCGIPIDNRFPYSLCPSCARTIRWANKANCSICGRALGKVGISICKDCANQERFFDRGFVCADYGFVERELIHDLKYKDKDYIAYSLGELMYEKMLYERIDIDIIASVPMHKKKQRVRGYNQADLLARAVAGNMDIPYIPNLLVRTNETVPMSSLNAKMRRENVKNVFSVSKGVQDNICGRDVLLIDDVITTGSTASECSLALKKGGAHKVYVLAFAAAADV